MSATGLILIYGLNMSDELVTIKNIHLIKDTKIKDDFLRSSFIKERLGLFFYYTEYQEYSYGYFIQNILPNTLVTADTIRKYIYDLSQNKLLSINSYLNSLWLIRDCSIKAMEIVTHFKINSFTNYEDAGNMSDFNQYFNANGKRTPTTFSSRELKKGYYFDKELRKLCPNLYVEVKTKFPLINEDTHFDSLHTSTHEYANTTG